MRGSRILLVSFFFFLAFNARAQLSGSWSGTYTAVSVGCVPSVPHGGTASMTISQNGNSVSGTAELEIFLFDCRTAGSSASAPSQIQIASFSGTASGSSFSATFPAGPGISGTISGTVQGDEMSFTFAAGDTTGNGRATRSGTPAADFSGAWRGQYTAVATFCTPPVAMNGTVSVTLSQVGSSLTGTLTIETPYFDCNPDSRTATAAIAGSVTGQSFSASFDATPTRAWPVGNIRGSLDGETVIASFVSGDTTGTATLSRPAPKRRSARH